MGQDDFKPLTPGEVQAFFDAAERGIGGGGGAGGYAGALAGTFVVPEGVVPMEVEIEGAGPGGLVELGLPVQVGVGGYIQTTSAEPTPAPEPRVIDWSGKNNLVHPAAKNLLLRSDQFGDAFDIGVPSTTVAAPPTPTPEPVKASFMGKEFWVDHVEAERIALGSCRVPTEFRFGNPNAREPRRSEFDLDGFRFICDETVRLCTAFVDGYSGRPCLHIEIIELERNPATEIRIGTRKPPFKVEDCLDKDWRAPPAAEVDPSLADLKLISLEVIDLLRIVRAETLSRGIKARAEAVILALGGTLDDGHKEGSTP